MCLFVE